MNSSELLELMGWTERERKVAKSVYNSNGMKMYGLQSRLMMSQDSYDLWAFA